MGKKSEQEKAKTRHPAKFSNELLPIIAKYCYGDIVDIMGGTGKVGLLKNYNSLIKSVCSNEIEEEWANQGTANGVDVVVIGDARFITGKFDCIVTSPPYGNRMADNFKPGKPDSMRSRYAGDLGRTPTKGSTSCSQFGDKYTNEMADIYENVFKNVEFDLFILNVSNFIRQFKEVDVIGWYRDFFLSRNFVLVAEEKVKTRRHRGVGANSHLRVETESVLVFKRANNFDLLNGKES